MTRNPRLPSQAELEELRDAKMEELEAELAGKSELERAEHLLLRARKRLERFRNMPGVASGILEEAQAHVASFERKVEKLRA